MRSLAGVQPQRGEDAVVASVRKMSNQQADDCAALIVEIFGALCRADVARATPAGGGRLHRAAAAALDRQAEEFQVPALSATN